MFCANSTLLFVYWSLWQQDGQVDRLQKLLLEYSYHVDVRDPESGDTPLITAARNGYEEV